jgi:NAD(P)-dependent dehydrogenase (short-subunit alcohol dehydrogenase family)
MGIGRAVAVELARQGARVVLNSSASGEALAQALADVRAAGGEGVACPGSVADYGFAGELVQRCVDEYGAIDILVNVAGVVEPPGSSILSIDPEDWQRQIDVHLNGTFYTCRHAAPLMVAQGHGRIVNTCSHGLLGIYGGTGYAAAKGGTYSLTLALAQDLRERGIRVNAVCPGAASRMSTGPDYEAHIDALCRRGILDESLREASLHPPPPEYLAPVYAFLASDLGAEITGRLFSAAGGYVGEFNALEERILAYKDHGAGERWEPEELARQVLAASA